MGPERVGTRAEALLGREENKHNSSVHQTIRFPNYSAGTYYHFNGHRHFLVKIHNVKFDIYVLLGKMTHQNTMSKIEN